MRALPPAAPMLSLGTSAGAAVTLAAPRRAPLRPPRVCAVALGSAARGRLLPLRPLRPGRRGAPAPVRATSDPNKDRVRERVNKIEEEINRQARA